MEMAIYQPATILLFAFLADCLLGDPVYPFHPVRLIGNGISLFLEGISRAGLGGKMAGVVLVLSITTASIVSYLMVRTGISYVHDSLAWIFDLYVCYSCIAVKDLVVHLGPVISALGNNDLAGAKKAVSLVVGRDVAFLDEAGTARAAVETLAENFVDGFLSPVFWYVAGAWAGGFAGWHPVVTAVCFMIIFKVASTLDSMVGYKNETFFMTGWAGARLDDVMNFIPARMSLVVLFFGAIFSGAAPRAGMRTALNDRLKHESPNSAHGESFVAGALNVRLGGPTRYADGLKEKPWLNEYGPDPEPAHIQRTIRLLNYSAWIFTAVAVVILVI